jgi:hypothetical protein
VPSSFCRPPSTRRLPPRRSRRAEIEQQIGMAVAGAVEAIGQGLVDFEAMGHLRDVTRAAAGKCLGEVCMLQLSHAGGDPSFTTIARREGKRVLWSRHGGTYRAHYGPAFDEAGVDRALDTNIGWVLGIARKVVADERARAH